MVATDLVVTVAKNLPARVWYGFWDWVKLALGNMATGEFWVNLCEKIVTQMWNAFCFTLGGQLLTQGLKREDPDVKKMINTYTSPQPVTASAFGGSGIRQDYPSSYPSRAAAEYNRTYPAPVPAPVDRGFPGFGGTTR